MAQCPANVDFEAGNLNSWSCYTSVNNGTGSYFWTATPPISTRHAITSGTAVDPFGGFPIVAPGGGTYSLKLGNNDVNSQMEQVRYTFTVPSNQNHYALIYRYAMVLQDPNHSASEQPFFKVRAYNMATGVTVNCGNFNYISSGNLPGFIETTPGSKLWYRPWSTGSLDLSGQAGNTIVIEFTSADFAQGGHFGYGYVDMSCGVFSIMNTGCNGSATTPLNAPPGFQSYTWYSDDYSVVLGTGISITIPTPASPTNFHVKLTPFPGYGCGDTLTTLINPSVLNVNAGNDTALCNNASIQLNAAVTGSAAPFTYSWSPAAGLSCTNCLNPVATPANIARYILSVTDNNGCVLNDTVQVKGKVQIVSNAQNVTCFNNNNGSVSVSSVNGATPYTYSWNTNPVQTTSTVSNLSAGTYTVNAVDVNGCMATQQVVITEPAQLVASVGTVQLPSCNGGSNGTATVNVTGGTAPYTYSWNTTPVKTTAAVSGLAAGTYIVTVKDANNCTDTALFVIGEPTPNGLLLTKTDPVCFGLRNGTAIATPAGGTAPYSYSWNTTPVQTTATVTGLPIGNYQVTVIDSKGCIVKDSILLQQPALLMASISKTNSHCFGDTLGSLSATIAGGVSPYSYLWNNNPLLNSAAYPAIAAGNYKLVATDSHGCTVTDSTVIRQPALLNGTMSQVNVSCYGQNDASLVFTPAGGTAPYHYSWNTAPVQTTPTLAALAAGTYKVNITDSLGCTYNATANVTQPAVLTASTSSNMPVCFGGNNGSASVMLSGGTLPYTYSWNTVPVQATATATGLPSGNYSVVIRDANGCTQNASVTINQAPQMSVTSVINKIPCYNIPEGIITATAAGGVLPYTYVWLATPRQTTATASGLLEGTYQIEVTDSIGCVSVLPVTLQGHPAINMNAGADQVICPSEQVQLNATAADTHFWTPATRLSCTPCANPLCMADQTTTYTVTGTDIYGCHDSDQVTVTVLTHDADKAGSLQQICEGSSVSLYVEGGVSYEWYPANTLNDAHSATPIATPAVTTDYQVAVMQNRCYTDTLHQRVEVWPIPVIKLDPDFKAIPGTELSLNAQTGKGATKIAWSPADGLSCANCFNPTATFISTITYTATVSNDIGCSSQDDITIAVACDAAAFYMANTFTPNGDGQHDWFYPQGKGVNNVSRFMIYNRWGEIVFSANNIPVNDATRGWDGTFRNQPLAPDVFMYVVEAICADGTPVQVKGDIALMR